MLSVTQPFERAFAWTKRILFTPFDVGKWFALGFCTFLAGLAGGPTLNFNIGNPFSRGCDPTRGACFAEGKAWIMSHLALVILLGILLLVLILTLVILVQWIGSRGAFMFLDGVAHDRCGVAEPWRRFKTLGNSLCSFRLSFIGLSLLTLALIGGLGCWIAWSDISSKHFGVSAVVGIVVGGGLFLLAILAITIVDVLLSDFVVPIMYLRELRVMDAWRVLFREVLPGNVGSILLFWLFRLALFIGAGLGMLVVGCCTCCIGFLPYLSSVIFLPVFVFFRAYTVCFLEQLGDGWKILAEHEHGAAEAQNGLN